MNRTKIQFSFFDLEANTDGEWDLSKMETIQIGYILFNSELRGGLC